jgi:hypothetical protein
MKFVRHKNSHLHGGESSDCSILGRVTLVSEVDMKVSEILLPPSAGQNLKMQGACSSERLVYTSKTE